MIEIANVDIQHPFFTHKEKVARICQPLFRSTPFSYFTYEQYHYDGGCIFLSYEPEMDYQVVKQHLLPTANELAMNNSHYVILSEAIIPPSEVPIQHDKYRKNVEVAVSFGVHHAIVLTFKHDHFKELFIFGVGKKINNYLDTFICHMAILEKFCLYFRHSADSIIQQLQNTRVKYDNEPIEDLSNQEIECFFEHQTFLSGMDLKKYPIKGKNGECYLSPRQFECLILMSKNKTAKQIAKQLNISPRTVEIYFQQLKFKLGCASKDELVEIANSQKLIKAFSSDY